MAEYKIAWHKYIITHLPNIKDKLIRVGTFPKKDSYAKEA